MSGARSRVALAVGGGLALLAGHAPLDWGWSGPLALVPLTLLARSLRSEARPARSGFAWGLLAGLVFFVPVLAWLKPFGFLPWLLLAGLQALSVAGWVALVAAWRGRRLWPLAAVVAWLALEAVRMRWPLGGFGWGVLGYTQHDGGPLLPLARLFGVLGVSAACAGLAVGLVSLGEQVATRRRRGALVAATAIALATVAVLSASALAPPQPSTRTVDIAAVQGNDLQRSGAAGVTRLDDGRIVAVARAMLDATRPLADDPPDVTIWPENSLDADPREDPDVGAALTEALALLGGRPLVAGSIIDGPRPGTLLNVAAEYGPGLVVDEQYVKRQTVPFAEYVPGRRWLSWVPPLRQIPNDMLGADEANVIDVAGVPLGIVICFENIFPGLAADQVDAGAEVLVVSTNNASFGRTPMSPQHLAFSQLRAVETGRWVLHAGISGISGIVDPHGNVTQRTPLYAEAIVRADLPLVGGVTPFLRIRHAVEALILLGGLVVLLVVAAPAVRRRSALLRPSSTHEPSETRHPAQPVRSQPAPGAAAEGQAPGEYAARAGDRRAP
jgi:apolipoprotein N-acyltransferase